MTNHTFGVDLLYAAQIEQHLLALREALVRFDENEKAYKLMEQCVPYFLAFSDLTQEAKQRTQAQTAHLRNPAFYGGFYANNPHELPYEEMFGRNVEDIGQVPRIAWLQERLEAYECNTILDLACNDGAILRYLLDAVPGLNSTTSLGVDLNPSCVQRASEQRNVRAIIGRVDAETTYGMFDAVFAGEVIEHVPDPVAFLKLMAQQGKHVLVTTPFGSVEKGTPPIPWDREELMGHVRSYTPHSLAEDARRAGLRPVDIVLAGGDTLCLDARLDSQ